MGNFGVHASCVMRVSVTELIRLVCVRCEFVCVCVCAHTCVCVYVHVHMNVWMCLCNIGATSEK